MSTHVVNAVVARHRAEMMVAAGEFMLAVKTIVKDHQEARDSGEELRFNQRTIAGLLDGLEVVGRKLITDGVEFIEDDNEMRQGV